MCHFLPWAPVMPSHSGVPYIKTPLFPVALRTVASVTSCAIATALSLHGVSSGLASLGPNGPLVRYVQLQVAHAPGMPGTFPRHLFQRKTLVNDPDMNHGTCVTHVPWCMSGWLTRGGRENVPCITGACATRNFTYLARGPWLLFTLPISRSLFQTSAIWYQFLNYLLSFTRWWVHIMHRLTSY